MKRILAGITLIAACALPALAQDSVRIAALEAKITLLESIVGVEGFLAPQLPCPIPDSLRPPAWFPNGEYNIAFRNRQFGCAFDPLSDLAYGLRAQMVGALQRLAVVEGNGAHNPPPSNPNFVIGDLVVTGRICVVVACKPEVPAQIQIQGPADAEILFISNTNGQDPQGSAAHSAMLSTSKDGGIRLLHNSHHQSGPNWLVWPEADKPRSIFGFDSQGTPSFSQDYDGAIYPSQSLIFNFDRQAKIVRIQSMKKGWEIGFCASLYADNNCGNSHWIVPVPQL